MPKLALAAVSLLDGMGPVATRLDRGALPPAAVRRQEYPETYADGSVSVGSSVLKLTALKRRLNDRCHPFFGVCG